MIKDAGNDYFDDYPEDKKKIQDAKTLSAIVRIISDMAWDRESLNSWLSDQDISRSSRKEMLSASGEVRWDT